jgi:hypothetical protein
MSLSLAALRICLALLASPPGWAAGGFKAHAPTSTPKDLAAINRLTTDLDAALIDKDASRLSAPFYELLLARRIRNYGVETWQVCKASDRSWRIFSVV